MVCGLESLVEGDLGHYILLNMYSGGLIIIINHPCMTRIPETTDGAAEQGHYWGLHQ